jgi:hypothetical protein
MVDKYSNLRIAFLQGYQRIPELVEDFLVKESVVKSITKKTTEVVFLLNCILLITHQLSTHQLSASPLLLELRRIADRLR